MIESETTQGNLIIFREKVSVSHLVMVNPKQSVPPCDLCFHTFVYCHRELNTFYIQRYIFSCSGICVICCQAMNK